MRENNMLCEMNEKQKAEKNKVVNTWRIRVWSEDVHEDFHGEEIKDVMEIEGVEVEVEG